MHPAPSIYRCAFYRRHSDFIEADLHHVQGVRIYTLFMYLNDVEEGGGTRFTDLPGGPPTFQPQRGKASSYVLSACARPLPYLGPLTFQPQRGKAILWPSVLADEPHTKDERTDHEALPVTGGEKYGANFWIHQYDFKGAHQKGCTAS